MTKLYKYSLILLLLILSPLAAQAELNLEQLQQAALEQRQTLQAQEHQIQRQEYRVQEQQGRYLPRVDLFYQGSESSSDYSIYERTPAYQAGAQMRWNLYNGGSDQAEKYAREQEMRSARLNLDATAQQVQLRVTLAFIDLWQARKGLNTAEKTLKQHEREASDAQLRYDAGVLRRDELLALQVAAHQARYERNTARTRMKQARNNLARESGLELEHQSLDFTPLIDEVPLPSVSEAYKQLQNHSSLEQFYASGIAAQKRARAAWGEHLPSSDISLSWTQQEDSWVPGEGNIDDDDVAIMLELNWNLFQGGQIKARENQWKQEAATQQAQAQEQMASLELQLNNLLLDRSVARDNLEVARENLLQAAESLRINRLSYQEGISTVAELLQSLTARTRAEYQRTSAQCDLRRAEYRIIGLLEAFPQKGNKS
jgi:outer membrane protein TolC